MKSLYLAKIYCEEEENGEVKEKIELSLPWQGFVSCIEVSQHQKRKKPKFFKNFRDLEDLKQIEYGSIKEQFECYYRGKISAKNVGEIDMYFVENGLSQ